MTDTNINHASEVDSEEQESPDNEQELWPSPGKQLKKLREELGFSPGKVSESLYITSHYVKALEEDNYAKLPGHTFIKGYYKAYAEFLNADTEQILTYYLKSIENSSNQNSQDAQAEESRNRNKTIFWTAIAVVVISVFVGAFLMLSSANAQTIPVQMMPDIMESIDD